MSPNQDIQLLLEGTAHLLPIGGTIWSHRAANARPYWKTYGKTNVGRHNFSNGWKHCSQAAKKCSTSLTSRPDRSTRKKNATPGVIAQARREARLATRKKIEAPSSASKSHLTSYDGVKKHGSLPVVPRKAVLEVSKIENYREASCCDAWMAERTDEPKGGWSCAFWSGCSGHLTHNCWM